MDASRTTQQVPSTASNSARTSPATTQHVPMYQQPAASPVQSSQSTEPFLKDFTLLAEAARRAQMGIMVRDLESFGLS
ncbi:hypothetical protein MCOR25_005901 [Pyricularia grisea]|uniref:Uncharacterized protein n=1 Tax=Pyricularia grisea TaxID=148305 RepID=A0A6P8B3H3_PYRGI|nr:uncharacterized protein PgNI_07671 [Pyricularia grisea]KAI6363408.1 hypothetical protein MCOR25_005901 [Pyricularia grisea]TLD09421.1 hypothetical protein PgNI_07671 [Pyricularia grisea]